MTQKLVHEGASNIDSLLQLISTDGIYVKLTVFNVLGEMGSDAKSAIPALLEHIRSTDGVVANAAIKAIHKIYLALRKDGQELPYLKELSGLLVFSFVSDSVVLPFVTDFGQELIEFDSTQILIEGIIEDYPI